MLHALNLHSIICQLYPNNVGGKRYFRRKKTAATWQCRKPWTLLSIHKFTDSASIHGLIFFVMNAKWNESLVYSGECKTRLTKASREIQDTFSSATLPQCSVLQAGRDHLVPCFTQQQRICLEVQHAHNFQGAAQRPGIYIASSGSSDGSELSGCPGTTGVAAWASNHQW